MEAYPRCIFAIFKDLIEGSTTEMLHQTYKYYVNRVRSIPFNKSEFTNFKFRNSSCLHFSSIVHKPKRRVWISCDACGHLLYVYHKKNGTNTRLVKVILERILEDRVLNKSGEEESDSLISEGTEGSKDICCPECGKTFARGPVRMGKYICNKIIQGRVSVME